MNTSPLAADHSPRAASACACSAEPNAWKLATVDAVKPLMLES